MPARPFEFIPSTLGLSPGDLIATYTNGGITFAQANSGLQPAYNTDVFPAGAAKFYAKALQAGSGTSLSTALAGESFTMTLVFKHNGTEVDTPPFQAIMSQVAGAGSNKAFMPGFDGKNTGSATDGFTRFWLYDFLKFGIMNHYRPHVLHYVFDRADATNGVATVYADGYFCGSKSVSVSAWETSADLVMGGLSTLDVFFLQADVAYLGFDYSALSKSDAIDDANALGTTYGVQTVQANVPKVLIMGGINSVGKGVNATGQTAHGFIGQTVADIQTENSVLYYYVNGGTNGWAWGAGIDSSYADPLDAMMLTDSDAINILIVTEDDNTENLHTGSPGAGDAATIEALAETFFSDRIAAGWKVIPTTQLYAEGFGNEETRIALNALRRTYAAANADILAGFADIDTDPLVGSGNPSTTPGSGQGMLNLANSDDGIHPLTVPHASIATNILKPVLKPLLPSVTVEPTMPTAPVFGSAALQPDGLTIISTITADTGLSAAGGGSSIPGFTALATAPSGATSELYATTIQSGPKQFTHVLRAPAPLPEGSTTTLSYSASPGAAISDANGRRLADFTGAAVTNSSTQIYDRYAGGVRPTQPIAGEIFDITPDDDNDLSEVPVMVNASAVCDLKVTKLNGDTEVVACAIGDNYLPCTRIWETGSTLNDAVLLGKV